VGGVGPTSRFWWVIFDHTAPLSVIFWDKTKGPPGETVINGERLPVKRHAVLLAEPAPEWKARQEAHRLFLGRGRVWPKNTRLEAASWP